MLGTPVHLLSIFNKINNVAVQQWRSRWTILLWHATNYIPKLYT